MENTQFKVLLDALDGIKSDVANIRQLLQIQLLEKEKVSQKEKDSMSNLLGGIIGGESIGGLRGKREGGKKGGTFTDVESGKSLKSFATEIHESVGKLNEMIFRHVDERQIAYLEQREQIIHSCKALVKLHKLGYNDELIRQALFNAYRDSFWQDKIKHLKALANTSKNGALVVENLLKINANETKLNMPVKAKFIG